MGFIDYAHRQFFVPERALEEHSKTRWPLQATFWFVVGFCSFAWAAIILACAQLL